MGASHVHWSSPDMGPVPEMHELTACPTPILGSISRSTTRSSRSTKVADLIKHHTILGKRAVQLKAMAVSKFQPDEPPAFACAERQFDVMRKSLSM